MPTLTIDFQEGFCGEVAEVRTDGVTACRTPPLTTRTQIGLADSLVMELPALVREVEVLFPGRSTAARVPLPHPLPPYLGVNLSPEGALEFQWAFEPFRYA